MIAKWIGAALVVAGCGRVGFSMASAHRKEEHALRQLIAVLDFMQCELQFRRTPLPELCRQAGSECRGIVGQVMMQLSRELESQISPDAESCMRAALSLCRELPARAGQALQILGASLGRFDMEGQVSGLEAARSYCRRELEALGLNRETRLRSYQTLGLCAGAGIAILFI